MGLGSGGICKPGGSSEAELVGGPVVLPQTPSPLQTTHGTLLRPLVLSFVGL